MSKSSFQSNIQKETSTNKSCHICLFEIDIQENQKHSSDIEKKVYSELSVMREIAYCIKCGESAHSVCVRFQFAGLASIDNYECLKCISKQKNQELICVVCKSHKGQIGSYNFKNYEFSGHFLCLYLSSKYVCSGKSFIPIKHGISSEFDIESSESSCQKCYKIVDLEDSFFKCKCGKVSHIFCRLYERMQALKRERYYDATERQFPILLLSKFLRIPYKTDITGDVSKMIAKTTNSNVFNNTDSNREDFIDFYKNENKELAIETSCFQIDCICTECSDSKYDSLFCCHKSKESEEEIGLIMCTVCSIWVHRDDEIPGGHCMRRSKEDKYSAKNALKHIIKSKKNTTQVNSSNSFKRKRNTSRDKTDKLKEHKDIDEFAEPEDQLVFLCKNCLDLGIQLINWQKDNSSEKIIFHENFMISFFLAKKLSESEKIGFQEIKKMKYFFEKHYYIKNEQHQLVDYFFEHKNDFVKMDEDQEIFYEKIKFFVAQKSVQKKEIEEIICLIDDFQQIFHEENCIKQWNIPISFEGISCFASVCKNLRDFLVKDNVKVHLFSRTIKKIIEEKLKNTDNQFSTMLSNFLIKAVLEPINQLTLKVIPRITEYEAKITLEGNLIKSSSFLTAKSIMDFIQQKIPLQIVESIRAEFNWNSFCLRYIDKIFGNDGFDFLSEVDHFNDSHDFECSFQKLLLIKTYDVTLNDQISYFIEKYFLFLEYKQKRREIELKLENLQKIENGKKFLDNFEENVSNLVFLEEFIQLNKKSSQLKIDRSFFEEVETNSIHFDSEFAEIIRQYELSPENHQLKKLLEKILDDVLAHNLVVSSSTHSFLKLFNHQLNCEKLLKTKKKYTLNEFEVIFNKIDIRFVHHTYEYRYLEREKKKREELESEIEAIFAKKISVEGLENIVQVVKDLKQKSKELRQKNEKLKIFQRNYDFWIYLDEILNEEVDESTPLNLQNIVIFESKLERTTLDQIQRMNAIKLSYFFAPELERLYEKALLRFWQLKMIEITSSKRKVEVSFLKLIKKCNGKDGEILARAYEKISNDKLNVLPRIRDDFLKTEKEIESLCVDLIQNPVCLQKIDTKISDFDKLLAYLANFKIDDQNLKEKMMFIFVFRVYFEIISLVKNFNDIYKQRSSDLSNKKSKGGDPDGHHRSSAKKTYKSEFIQENQETAQEELLFANFKSKLIKLNLVLKSPSFELRTIDENIEQVFVLFRNNVKVFDRIQEKLHYILPFFDSNEQFDGNDEIEEEELKKRYSNLQKHGYFSKNETKIVQQKIEKYELVLNELENTIVRLSKLTLAEIKKTPLLKNLQKCVESLKRFRISSDKKTENILTSYSIFEVFSCDEKQHAIVSKTMHEFCEKWRDYKNGKVDKVLYEDIIKYEEELNFLGDELKSLQTRVELDSDFAQSINDLICFIEKSPIQCSFSYYTYTEFSREVQSIANFLEDRPSDYISFLANHDAKIQLTENLQNQINKMKKNAKIINEYVEKNVNKMSNSKKLDFYSFMEQKENQLSPFHDERVWSILEEVRNKRERFEKCDSLLTKAIYSPELNDIISSINWDELITQNYLNSSKQNFYVSDSEMIEYLLKRCYLLVTHKSNEIDNLSDFLEKLKIDKICEKFEKKSLKKPHKLKELVKGDWESLVYLLLKEIRERNRQYEFILQKNDNFRTMFEELKRSFENNKDRIYSEIDKIQKKTNYFYSGSRFMEIENQNYDNLSLASFLIKDIIEDSNLVKNRKMQNYQRGISANGPELAQNTNLAKEFYDELVKVQMIEKNENIRKKMMNLSNDLADWVEEDIKENRYCPTIVPNNLIKVDQSNLSQTASLIKRPHVNFIESNNSQKPMNLLDNYNDFSQDNFSRSVVINRYDETKKYISRLNQKPNLCRELEKNNFSWEHVAKVITKSDDIKPLQRQNFMINENSRNSQKSVLNVSFSNKAFDGSSNPPKNEEKNTNLPILDDIDASSKTIAKKIKLGLENSPFPSKTPSLGTLVWTLKLFSFNYFDEEIDFELMTSMQPELHGTLGKTNIFIKAKISNSSENANKNVSYKEIAGSMRNHHNSRGLIGATPFNLQISSVIDKIKSGKLSFMSLFGGWFEYRIPKHSDQIEGQQSQIFSDLLNYTRKSECLIEEVFSMNNETFKIYIGSVLLVNMKILQSLQIRNVNKEKETTFWKNCWIFLIHKNIDERSFRSNQGISDYVSGRIFEEERNVTFEEKKFVETEKAENLVNELKTEALRILNMHVL